MERKTAAHNRKEGKYAYEIDLLLRGFPVKDVELLSKTMGNKASFRTLYRLKDEFCSLPTKNM